MTEGISRDNVRGILKRGGVEIEEDNFQMNLRTTFRIIYRRNSKRKLHKKSLRIKKKINIKIIIKNLLAVVEEISKQTDTIIIKGNVWRHFRIFFLGFLNGIIEFISDAISRKKTVLVKDQIVKGILKTSDRP